VSRRQPSALSALAQKKYDTGATDTEIKIGDTKPYSGPASAYGTIGKAIAAYFDKINAEGGINGRKIKFISLDDGYNPAKTVEQVRKLSRKTRCCSSSTRWGRRRTRRSTST
jgi:branched-chain amino acid transport system substrate-binding protein